MENKKTGLTAKNWILSILGIILLCCVIILPPVFRIVYKEDNNGIPEETSYPIVMLNCYKENIETEDYTDKETLTFYSQNSQIKKYTKKIERTYYDALLYQQEKPNFGKLVTAFSIITGYEYTLTPNDELSTLIITETYDLEKFQDTNIVIPGDSDTTEIKSDYHLNDIVGTAKSNLITNGYICE